MSRLHDMAARLRAAELSQTPCDRLSDDVGGLSIEDAYAVQRIQVDARVQAGARIVGRKIGITSKAVMQWLKVDQPDYGALLSDMVVPDGGTCVRSQLLQPRVEGEVAFVLGADLDMPHVDVNAVLRATSSITAAIEIIDSRVRDWNITISDTIADNASSARFVLSSQRRAIGDLDLSLVGCALRVNGRVMSTGAGAACLGNPLHAVVWLANALRNLGTPLRSGDVVLSGALCPVVPVNAGDVVELDVHGVGSCSVRFVS
jgi:2-oxopent-4-enoate hydratase